MRKNYILLLFVIFITFNLIPYTSSADTVDYEEAFQKFHDTLLSYEGNEELSAQSIVEIASSLNLSCFCTTNGFTANYAPVKGHNFEGITVYVFTPDTYPIITPFDYGHYKIKTDTPTYYRSYTLQKDKTVDKGTIHISSSITATQFGIIDSNDLWDSSMNCANLTYYYNYTDPVNNLPNGWQNPVNGDVDNPQNWTVTQVVIKKPGDKVQMDGRKSTFLDVVINGKVFVDDVSSFSTISSLKGAISGSAMLWIDDDKVLDFPTVDDNVKILSSVSDIKKNGYYTFQLSASATINQHNEGGSHKITFGCNVVDKLSALGIANSLKWLSCSDHTEFLYYVDENNDGIDDNTGVIIPPTDSTSQSPTENIPSDGGSSSDGILSSVSGLLNKATNTINGMKDLINGFSSAIGSLFAFLPSPIGEFIVIGIVIMIMVAIIGFIRG